MARVTSTTLWRGAALCLVGVLLLGLLVLPAAVAAPRVRLTMFIWAGANQGVVPREVVARYVRTHPHVEVEFWESNNTVTYPRMVAAKQANPNNPLIHFGYFNVDASSRGDVDDMWLPLDPARIPNMRAVHASLRRPGNRGIGYGISALGLMYNKDLVKDPPDSWTALWDPKWRGKVTFFDNNFFPLVLAARLNGGSERNIDPGFRIWAENAKNIRALVTSNDQLKNMLVSGEALLAPWFTSIWAFWAAEGAPLGFVNPKEGVIAFPIYLQIVKGSTPEQVRVAEEIINELLATENNARYARLTYSIPAIPGAPLSPTVEKILNPRLLDTAIWLDWATMAQQASVWRQRWEREVKSRL
ncbi:MAG: extracellular solute-binding protein [Armatimonadota bacterium]|nr:extracellular solute-binding protein [Armatimonadota bacterium]MDR7448755.1 extracellular solute-binding protein [Armatimonadota bacterium]MDR7459225.1 extracellular solute-binding protein [Armatimonadota bacterium]MDR7479673.1 extracellular solute-binding protein [Armatimonadota bacterium]MDR7487810.1 extracellular solute-binding protein [Armatimonadota bacterium]